MARSGSADRGLVGRRGPFTIDWPRSAGYFGGIGLATVAGLVDPPLAVFIAVVPFIKMLNTPEASAPVRYVSQFFEGMAKPVGGDSEGTVTLAGELPAPVRSPSRAVSSASRRLGSSAPRSPRSQARRSPRRRTTTAN
ncbi:MAG: hypothetical protein NVSMB29_03380 [Candidatus Dormibacteria bacterium]